MSDAQTPATSPDPELAAEGDTDQLDKQDTLVPRGVDDLLDEGYSPPERDPLRGEHLTEAEQAVGDTLDDRLAAETPEAWEADATTAAEREPDRAGRLHAKPDPSALDGPRQQDVLAEDVGVAGGAATVEEAAVRERDEDAGLGLTDEGSSIG